MTHARARERGQNNRVAVMTMCSRRQYRFVPAAGRTRKPVCRWPTPHSPRRHSHENQFWPLVRGQLKEKKNKWSEKKSFSVLCAHYFTQRRRCGQGVAVCDVNQKLVFSSLRFRSRMLPDQKWPCEPAGRWVYAEGPSGHFYYVNTDSGFIARFSVKLGTT
jgi:hypothetical protein